MPASTVLTVPPISWMVMARRRPASFCSHQPADLVHLAAQAEHEDAREIRMPRIAAERAAEQRQRLVLGHAAAGLVGQRDDAVDIRKIGQRIVAGERILLEDVGDEACDMRAAIHRGEHADVVPRRDAAVRAQDALEGRGQVEFGVGLTSTQKA